MAITTRNDHAAENTEPDTCGARQSLQLDACVATAGRSSLHPLRSAVDKGNGDAKHRDRDESDRQRASLDKIQYRPLVVLQRSLTHVNEVAVVPRHEVAEGRQLVGHVQDVLAGGVASTNPHRLLVQSTHHGDKNTPTSSSAISSTVSASPHCFERLKSRVSLVSRRL